MAPRHKVRHDENTRAKIRADYLITRLQAHVAGKVDLSASQVRSAEILLRKVMPDLMASDNRTEVVHTFAEVPKVLSEDQWLKKRGIVSGEPSPVRRPH
jgi:hypothetical protein